MKTACSRSGSQTSQQSALAFTLTELLAVIVVIVILIILQLPAWGKAGSRTRIAECSGNVRQLVLASHIYGSENGDKLPVMSSGNWGWDMAGPQVNTYTQYVSWETFYCPDSGFEYSGNWALWNYGAFHVVGYGLTFSGTATLITSNANATITPLAISPGGPIVLPPPTNPSQRVLFADATISRHGQTDESLRYTYTYTGITGAYTHRTSHMNGPLPAGGNLGMLDGHVEWRKFGDMRVRSSVGAEPNSPTFWW